MTLKTTDGFWRSFDRDHEPVPLMHGINPKPEGLKTTQHAGFMTNGFTCLTCEMPCHAEHRLLDYSLQEAREIVRTPVDLTYGRAHQSIWVPRHGPAPYSSNIRNTELAGTVPVIELPDAVGVAESQTRRHYVHGIQTLSLDHGYRAECGIGDLYRYQLGQCWEIPLCENCRKLFE